MNKFLSILIILGFLAPANALENKDYYYENGPLAESLVPLFLAGGYHMAGGYKYNDFRIRASIIYSGSYDAEPSGIDNSADRFSRFYDHGSSGLFLDWFPLRSASIARGLHLYVFAEYHRWKIEQQTSGAIRGLSTFDWGPGLAWQIFIWRAAYVQPGIHYYVRSPASVDFPGETYTIPSADFTFVLRFGWQF